VLAALVADIRLGRAQVIPVGLRLDAEPFDRGELALDAEQPTRYSIPRSFVACRTRSISCSNENSGVWTPMTTNPSSR
jgi:hypothetical protein